MFVSADPIIKLILIAIAHSLPCEMVCIMYYVVVTESSYVYIYLLCCFLSCVFIYSGCINRYFACVKNLKKLIWIAMERCRSSSFHQLSLDAGSVLLLFSLCLPFT